MFWSLSMIAKFDWLIIIYKMIRWQETNYRFKPQSKTSDHNQNTNVNWNIPIIALQFVVSNKNIQSIYLNFKGVVLQWVQKLNCAIISIYSFLAYIDSK